MIGSITPTGGMALQGGGATGLPMLIDLDPQYPLAQSPDLIQPGWKLNVG